MHAAILCINWICQEPQNQHLPHISLPTIEELYALQVDENAEENIQNEVYDIEEFIQNQSDRSDESNKSDEEKYESFESYQLNEKNWFFDFQNTNTLAL